MNKLVFYSLGPAFFDKQNILYNFNWTLENYDFEYFEGEED